MCIELVITISLITQSYNMLFIVSSCFTNIILYLVYEYIIYT